MNDAPASTQTSLDQVSVPRLLFALLHKRFTGTLSLDQPEPDPGRRTVWVRGGMPVFTDWVVPQDVLGQVLLEHGSVTPQQLTEALAQTGPAVPLGKVLTDHGVVATEKLAHALREQCSRKLVQLFKLRSGVVNIVGINHDLGRDDELWQVNVLGLLQRGITRHYDENRVLRELGQDANERITSTRAFARYRNHFQFAPEDEAVLQALAKGTHFQALINEPGMNRDRAAQVTFVLWACQMLQIGDGKSARTSGATAPQPTAPARPAAAPGHRSRPRPAPVPGPAPQPAARPTPQPATAPAPQPAAAPTPNPGPEPTPAPPSAPPSAPSPSRAPKPAPAPSPPAVSGGADDPEFVAELGRFEQLIADGAHAFDLLGIPLDAGKREIRRAWGDLSRVFHPDALAARRLQHLHDRVEQVFAALSEAHLTLNDQEQRGKLRAVIEAGGDISKPNVDAAALMRAALESEVIAREGDKLLIAGKFDRALASYDKALALNDDEPDLKAAVIWCRFQLSRKTSTDQLQSVAGLDAILEEVPNLARAHYFRGMILVMLGKDRLAIQAFHAAHDADPKLVDAERQARAISMRHGGGKKKKKGLFGR